MHKTLLGPGLYAIPWGCAVPIYRRPAHERDGRARDVGRPAPGTGGMRGPGHTRRRWRHGTNIGRDSTTLALAAFIIRIFSTGSRDDTELPLIADRLQRYDLIAIQEVRDTEVVDRVLLILAGRGLDYEAIVSEPVGKEHDRTVRLHVAAGRGADPG